ncbi:MAG: selenocysteine-specific translation elongation factor [Limnochordia bacterium]|jgi:selenocysteine-specific elongation factor|nr:selenocysteine-specific translation elongation factor [Limnochordia bacterium]
MFIMGTAGHIDHGKSTLITALTGINPDRLQEEQARGMTVDLGFAWFSLPGGNVGVVDVPGHHRLVKNMLAGIGQVDFTLLVIAADDGWMPQTQEHVEILDLYGVKRGIVALTKADLVEGEWLDLVEADIHEHLAETSLKDFPIIPVSAVTGMNIDVLKAAINELLIPFPQDQGENNPLLWIDRVFTIKGAGTVVTGTLVGGSLQVGMDVVIEPPGHQGRIRTLQTQTKTVETGVPHSRLAVNLTGVEKASLARGMYLALPKRRPYFSLINSYVRVLPQAPSPLETGQQVKLYVGTLETLAAVKVLGAEHLDPGQEGYVQLELEIQAHFSFQDRFIIRHSELQDTLGGGKFIEGGVPVRGTNLRLVGPKRLRHLFPFEKPEAHLDLEALKAKHQGDKESLGLVKARDRTYWTQRQFKEEGLTTHPDLHLLGDYILAPEQYAKVQSHLRTAVEAFHRANPLAPGPSKETLRAGTGLPSRLFDQILSQTRDLKETRGAISSTKHQVTLSDGEEQELEKILVLMGKTPYEPLTLGALNDLGFSSELLYAGSHLGRLVALQGEHWTTPAIVNGILDIIFGEEAFQGGFELSTFRDRLNTSRKFALTFLEYFDVQGITKRKGDARTLGKRPENI